MLPGVREQAEAQGYKPPEVQVEAQESALPEVQVEAQAAQSLRELPDSWDS